MSRIFRAFLLLGTIFLPKATNFAVFPRQIPTNRTKPLFSGCFRAEKQEGYSSLPKNYSVLPDIFV